MPKTKKTRRKYKPRHRPTYALFLRQADMDRLREMFADIECVVEIKLPRGTCTLQDVYMMRDYLNLGTTLLHLGHHVQEKYVEAVEHDWRTMQDAFETFYKRAMKQHCFTCYASEINVLRDGFILLGEVILAEFEREPAWVLDCFYGLTEFLDRGEGKRVSVDMDVLEANIRRIRSQRLSPRAIREGR
jgi:hypothetical protein